MIKKTRFLSATLLAAAISPLAIADNVIKVPRESGAVHSEFKTLLSDYVSQFKSGVGRIALEGKSGGDRCHVDFYTNDNTTFVTVNVDNGDFYNEFYIDHPTQSFRKILFQNLTMREDGVKLEVVKRDGGYSILTDGQRLTVTTKVKTGDDSSCTFNLAKADFFEGQTE